MFFDTDELAPPATPGEAHAEWHLNTGVPMGPRGGSCPWDACGWDYPEQADDPVGSPADYAELDALLADEWLPVGEEPPF